MLLDCQQVDTICKKANGIVRRNCNKIIKLLEENSNPCVMNKVRYDTPTPKPKLHESEHSLSLPTMAAEY